MLQVDIRSISVKAQVGHHSRAGAPGSAAAGGAPPSCRWWTRLGPGPGARCHWCSSVWNENTGQLNSYIFYCPTGYCVDTRIAMHYWYSPLVIPCYHHTLSITLTACCHQMNPRKQTKYSWECQICSPDCVAQPVGQAIPQTRDPGPGAGEGDNLTSRGNIKRKYHPDIV